jgi:hypothetical protein
MEQWRNGPSIHANQDNQEGAHKSKTRHECVAEALRHELSGKDRKHRHPMIQPFNWSPIGKDLERPASRARTRIGRGAGKWLRSGR